MRKQEHPFAPYIRILGKGKRGSRSLTEAESYQAFSMILQGQVTDEQLGAFLMLLRVNEETPAELVGFVKAVKHYIDALPHTSKPHVDLDWPSYAGKRKHHTWYLLSARTLAKHGIHVCIHGAAGHTLNRIYTKDMLAAIDMPLINRIEDIQTSLTSHHCCYVPVALLQPTLARIIDMRHLFGLRSPVHTLARLINPFYAKASIQSIFHPAYQQKHVQAVFKLGYHNSLVIKGDGGEFERNPDARTLVLGIRNQSFYNIKLPKLNHARSPIENDLSAHVLQHFWLTGQCRDKAQQHYAYQAVIETLALALISLQKADSYHQAVAMATQMWQTRH